MLILRRLFLSAALLMLTAWAENAKVKVGFIALPSHAPNFLAKERGFYAEEGLDAELVPFQAAQAMAVAIASGDIDFGVTAVSGGLLNLAARGDAVRIFGGALTEAKGTPGHVLLASKAAFDAGLQSLAAFRRGFTKGAALYNAALVDKSLSEAEVAAVVADVHRYVFVDKPEVEAARLIQAGAMRVSPDAALNRADVLKQVQWFRDEKLVPDALDGNALLVD